MLSPRIADINGDRRADLPSVEDFNNSQQYMSRGDGTFDRVTETHSGWTNENGMGFEIGDYDKNGDLDILNVNNKDDATLPVQVPCPAAPTLLRNDTDNSNHWIQVTLPGTPSLHRNGIGSRVNAKTGNVTQLRELNSSTTFQGHGPTRIAHLGLSWATAACPIRNSTTAVARRAAFGRARRNSASATRREVRQTQVRTQGDDQCHRDQSSQPKWRALVAITHQSRTAGSRQTVRLAPSIRCGHMSC